MRLKIYTDTIELIRVLRDVIIEIARHDADLARQTRRALSSVALNIAEGEHRRDGHARSRFGTAMGSANEVRACLEVAEAFGYFNGGLTEIHSRALRGSTLASPNATTAAGY